ncbi:MAG: hypothetical protein P8Y62_04430 [candidate division WOR-3 bacterium]
MWILPDSIKESLSLIPDVNFNDWYIQGEKAVVRALTINANQWAILRWDLGEYKNLEIDGSGLLELTTYSAAKGGNYIETFGEDFGMEFGKVRVIEIIGGNPLWDQNTVTYRNFVQGKNYADVFNTQMVYDLDVNDKPGGKNFITISKPVLQRLLDGKTKGLLIRPLGAIDACFYASENRKGNRPKLHFNLIR